MPVIAPCPEFFNPSAAAYLVSPVGIVNRVGQHDELDLLDGGSD
jgi:hypothetical protein